MTSDTMNKKINNNSGFTLVEILVAMSIFVTAMIAVTAIFSFSNQTQRTTQAVQELQSDARFAMEIMAQQIRRSSIYYASTQYGGSISSNPQDVLVLLNNNNEQAWFRRGVSGSQGILEISSDGSAWEQVSPPEINVDLLKFYISPSSNPFISNPTVNIQPKVTIVMRTSNTSRGGENLSPNYLQTTVSSRQYLR